MGEVLKGYKAFKKGLICDPTGNKPFQYAENTVFEQEESAEICHRGFHFCKNPLGVLDYYPLVNENGEMTEFAEVEALDECFTNDNEKYCTKKIKIGAKISFPALVQASVDFELEKGKTKKHDKDDEKISSKGYSAKIGSSGDSAQIGSSGYSAKIGSSGDSAQIGSSGDSAKIGSSGDYAQIGSSGDSAKIGSSGDYAQIGSSGDYAKIGSSGDYAKIGSSGDYAQIESTGLDSVICCAGHNSKVKAKKGSWITLAEWEYSEEKERYVPKCVKTEYVDGERIKEDTFYILENGEFTERE
ncbi:MAG: hypothetical protein J6A43_03630 [Clostridia bacterium]|nr:hypothetical protein [Clostridia bacterium]